MATRMLQRRGTAAEWAAENPILASGEIGFETDTKMMKMGDGVTPWNSLSLPYVQTAGGTMTGALNLIAPTADAHAVRRIDLDNKLTGLQQILYYTSSGTFVKANYPWLRRVRARVQGGGGGASGTISSSNDTAGCGGGGGAYTERWIPVGDLPASVPITVGAAGVGASAHSQAGGDGGTSLFGDFSDSWRVTATGGGGGSAAGYGGAGGSTGAGDVIFSGDAGGSAPSLTGVIGSGGNGGAAHLGGGGRGAAARSSNVGGHSGAPYGGGGGGGYNRSAGGLGGPSGAQGIVIVELYS